MFGSTGFLCDQQSGYGALQCYTHTGGCQGATYGNCLPQGIWSSKQVSDTFAWSPELLSGSFYEWRGEGGHELVFAFSVRCLLLALYGHRVRPHPYHPRLRCAVSWSCAPQ